jgi:hypothetical protein
MKVICRKDPHVVLTPRFRGDKLAPADAGVEKYGLEMLLRTDFSTRTLLADMLFTVLGTPYGGRLSAEKTSF